MGLIFLIVVVIAVMLVYNSSKKQKTTQGSSQTAQQSVPISEKSHLPSTVEGKLSYFVKIAKLISDHYKISMVSILCVQRRGMVQTWSKIDVTDVSGWLSTESFVQLLRGNGYNSSEIQEIKKHIDTTKKGNMEISIEDTANCVFDPNVLKKVIWDVVPDAKLSTPGMDDELAFSILALIREDWEEDLTGYIKKE